MKLRDERRIENQDSKPYIQYIFKHNIEKLSTVNIVAL